jgi:hypothetical protein
MFSVPTLFCHPQNFAISLCQIIKYHLSLFALVWRYEHKAACASRFQVLASPALIILNTKESPVFLI